MCWVISSSSTSSSRTALTPWRTRASTEDPSSPRARTDVFSGSSGSLLTQPTNYQTLSPPTGSVVKGSRKGGQSTIATLLERYDATLRGHLREADRIGELRSQLRKVRLGHPTGDRTRASDIHRYLEVPDLLYEFPKRWESHAVHGVDDPRLHQARRLAQERYAAVYLRAPRTRGHQERQCG